jgi:hypothetical protein
MFLLAYKFSLVSVADNLFDIELKSVCPLHVTNRN